MGAVYNGQGSIDAQGNQVLAESAQQHEAMGEEPNVVGARKPDAARQLVNEKALYAAIDSLATPRPGDGLEPA